MEKTIDTTAINKARIVYYGLFSSLFSFNMNEDSFETVVRAVDILMTDPIDEQSEKSLDNMKRRLTKNGFKGLKKENHRIFYSPLNAPVPMTASFFAEGRDDGLKRVEMVDYVQESSFRRDGELFKEHEDHIEFVMMFLLKLISEELEGDLVARGLAAKVYGNILNSMIDQFTDKVFNHPGSYFYKQAALALRSFTAFERLYLNIPKPGNQKSRAILRHEREKKRESPRGCINLDANR